MSMPGSIEPQRFKEMEQSGWHAKAVSYNDLFGPVTRDAMGPMLDATCVTAGMTVLDVACGPGYGAAEAAARGATPIGIDFATIGSRPYRDHR